MKKREMKTYVEKTIEHYLDEVQKKTNNYQDTFDLWEADPTEIVLMPNNRLKHYVSVLNVCKNSLPIREIAVKFVSGTFRVKIKTY